MGARVNELEEPNKLAAIVGIEVAAGHSREARSKAEDAHVMRGLASPMIAGSSMRRSSACGTRKRCKWPLLAALAARIAAARCRMLTSASGGRPGRGAPSPGGIGDALGYPFHISCRACYRIRNIGNGVCGCEWTGESKGWWVAWGAGQKDSGLSKQTGLNKFNDLRRAIQRMVWRCAEG